MSLWLIRHLHAVSLIFYGAYLVACTWLLLEALHILRGMERVEAVVTFGAVEIAWACDATMVPGLPVGSFYTFFLLSSMTVFLLSAWFAYLKDTQRDIRNKRTDNPL
jgi:hypothetical protein